MKKMSPRQEAAMWFILGYEEEHGVYPGLRELAIGLGVSSTNGVQDHLVALRKKGWLRPTRYIIPTEEALAELLGPACPHCHRGRVKPGPERLRLLS